MRNPARLAADLSGRPLLLREASVPALARMLGIEGGERPAGMLGFLAQARAAITGRGDAEDARTEPGCYSPRWLGEADATGFGWTLKDGVACIEIDSCLMAEGFGWGDTWYHGYDTLLTAYEEMASDARVKAVFEVVSSPGGVVDPGLPELAAFKRQIRAAAGGKPVWTFARDAYSAAYWIASQSDRIIAPREGGVGSIGAVVAHCDISGLLAKEGIQITAFKFGKRKTDGSPFEPLSDTASETLQAEIDQCGRWFVADVLAGRAVLTEEGVLATEAGCYFGQADDPARSGLALNLVDEIQTERLAFAALRELAAKSPTPPAAPAAPAATKDTDMKRSAVLAAAQKAGLNKDQIRKLTAALPEDDAPADDDAPAEDDDAPAEDDEAAAEDAPAEDDAASDDDEGGDDAKAIAASAEAKAHPALAMAAISSGQTLAQFKASAAAAPAGGAGRLASTLGGSPRLGADGGGGKKTRLSAREQVAKNSAAGRARG
jgi:ClpP class serine protease